MNSAQSSRRGLTRRRFLGSSIAIAGLSRFALRAADSPVLPKLTAAVIGHTGQGNYGHDHDLIFGGRDNIAVLAVADPDEAGRAKAVNRCRALRSYADYRQMLEKEKPNLISVAPRCTHEHHAMAMAALRVGAHVYLEKPITQTLAEADELLGVARQKNLKVVVAHQVRLAPNIISLKESLEEGLIGDLLEVRAHGKQDSRAGGEDLIVLGVHLFDLMRFFAGDPQWCAARVLRDGREITVADARPATENIGPVAGNDLTAEFAFPNGVRGTFASRAKYRETAGPWGMQLIGSKGAVSILVEMVPRISLREAAPWTPEGKIDRWLPWRDDPTKDWPAASRGLGPANARVVDDWLAAIANDRDPVCSGTAGMKALEMAHAVFAAGLSHGRVELPLENRRHPLA